LFIFVLLLEGPSLGLFKRTFFPLPACKGLLNEEVKLLYQFFCCEFPSLRVSYPLVLSWILFKWRQPPLILDWSITHPLPSPFFSIFASFCFNSFMFLRSLRCYVYILLILFFSLLFWIHLLFFFWNLYKMNIHI